MGSKKKQHDKSVKCFVSPLYPAERWIYLCVTVATIAYICYCVYRDSISESSLFVYNLHVHVNTYCSGNHFSVP